MKQIGNRGHSAIFRGALRGPCIAAILFCSGTGLLAQTLNNPAKLSDAQLGRGDQIRIEIINGPAASTPLPVVKLTSSDGTVVTAEGPTYEPPATGKPAGIVTALIPDRAESAPLGKYLVEVQFNGGRPYKPGELSIRPPGNPQVHLDDFSPAFTYDTETAYVPGQSKLVGESIDVADYALHLDKSKLADIGIEWQGATHTPVLNGCEPLPPLGSQANPVGAPHQFFAKAPTDGSLTLCRIPTDARISVSGESVSPNPSGSSLQMWIRKSTRGIATPTVRLALHGSGFQVAHPGDNAIWINGARQDIAWATCSDSGSLGTASSPQPLKIHGEVIRGDEIHLCMIPVPGNGQLRLMVGVGDLQSEARVFRVFNMGEVQVGLLAGVIALILALLPLGLLDFVRKSYRIGGSDYKFRMLFLDPETDTYSLSKLQFYMWTVAALFGYAYLFISRVKVQFAAWPDVPATLPGIIAVSAGTAIGAQVVTAMRGSKGSGEEQPSFADFITSGGVVAADRLQMFLWTILGVGAFFYAILQLGPGTITDLPPVPDRLLVLMGLSSAGYLGGKMARKPGPVINEISITPSESDAGVAKGKATSALDLPDLVQPVVAARARLSQLNPGTNPNAKAALDAWSASVKAAGAAQTVSEFNQLIADLAQSRASAEASAAKAADDFAAGRATPAEAQAAQAAAAAMQDFSADVTQAISMAAAAPMASETTPALIRRTIELRGTNLATDAMFQIDNADLPFRMLFNKDGMNAPEILARDATTPTFASLVRLSIDPARLGTADREQLQKWFATDGHRTFTITNPDGQKSDLGFDLPPGVAQKAGDSR